jgi:hypothetical protein
MHLLQASVEATKQKFSMPMLTPPLLKTTTFNQTKMKIKELNSD